LDTNKIDQQLQAQKLQARVVPMKDNDNFTNLVNLTIKRWNNDQYKVPAFHILPKLHKVPIKSRPITLSHSWVMTDISKIMDIIFKECLKDFPQCPKDSISVINSMENIEFPNPITFVAADVESFYTSIPQEECLEIVAKICQYYKFSHKNLDLSILVLNSSLTLHSYNIKV
jgi:hypothetical protein